jgi:hypothetical protein
VRELGLGGGRGGGCFGCVRYRGKAGWEAALYFNVDETACFPTPVGYD